MRLRQRIQRKHSEQCRAEHEHSIKVSWGASFKVSPLGFIFSAWKMGKQGCGVDGFPALSLPGGDSSFVPPLFFFLWREALRKDVHASGRWPGQDGKATSVSPGAGEEMVVVAPPPTARPEAVPSSGRWQEAKEGPRWMCSHVLNFSVSLLAFSEGHQGSFSPTPSASVSGPLFLTVSVLSGGEISLPL